MNNNFFKKHFLIIFITLSLIIGAIIVFYKLSNDSKPTVPSPSSTTTPTSETVSNLEPKLDNNDSKPNLPNEQETKQPKIKTTQERFNQIKAYIHTYPNDDSLLPNDFTKVEQIQIQELLKYFEQIFGEIIKKDEVAFLNYQKLIKEYNKKTEEIKKQLSPLQQQKTDLETRYNPKNNELQSINQRLKQMREQKEAGLIVSLINNPEYQKLHTQRKPLSDEIIKLVDKIAKIGVQIADLEAEQKMYEEMLETTTKAQNNLKCNQDRYNQYLERHDIDAKLANLYEIISP